MAYHSTVLSTTVGRGLAVIVALMFCAATKAESPKDSRHVMATANPMITLHRVGKVGLARANTGIFGSALLTGGPIDVFTGEKIENTCEYPRGSGLSALWACGYWIGAIVGNDTLVTTSYDPDILDNAEISTLSSPFGGLVRRSTLDPDDPEFPLAVSQEDIRSSFNDTLTIGLGGGIDYLDNRRHQPLGVEITETSYAWSFGYAEDFVLFNIELHNIQDNFLEKLYFGVLSGGHAGLADEDDIGGFHVREATALGCGVLDTINVMWGADNDGDPVDGRFNQTLVPYRSQPHVSGIHFLGIPPDPTDRNLRLSFNWWTGIPRLVFTTPPFDFGPRKRDGFRDFLTGGLGTPKGDRNRYHVLSNGELDYPTFYTSAIGIRDISWSFPNPSYADFLTIGTGQYRLLSIGPFELPPGGKLRLPFALAMGENLHLNPFNIENLPGNPDDFADNLDFSDLARNILWAEWIYDNPGVDTDADGFAGEFRICNTDSTLIDGTWIINSADTTYYRGDGIPDWRAANPPPAPQFWLEPIENGIRIRFNGSRSETELDQFSRTIDFEGYRIYMGRDTREENLDVISSFDRHNYDKWVWNQGLGEFGGWEVKDIPLSIDSLRCLYSRLSDPCSDEGFDPLEFTPANPYRHRQFIDSAYFFKAHEYNAFELGQPGAIRKVYPDVVNPAEYHPDSIPQDAYTDDGLYKYYEYEHTVAELLPTVPYWINVTAFDYGAPAANFPALETSRTLGAEYVYPLASNSGSARDDGPLNVYVYPNPYRIDAGYRSAGYEGRLREDRPDDRVREVHFANLPPTCRISIYSLDGDLIRAIDHEIPESDPNHTHDSWDLITRNTQRPVSGLYYWVVEASDGRTQIGKLVLIM